MENVLMVLGIAALLVVGRALIRRGKGGPMSAAGVICWLSAAYLGYRLVIGVL